MIKNDSYIDQIMIKKITGECKTEEEAKAKTEQYRENKETYYKLMVDMKVSDFSKNISLLKLFNKLTKTNKNLQYKKKKEQNNKRNIWKVLWESPSSVRFIIPYLFIDRPKISFDYYVVRQNPIIQRMIDLHKRMEIVSRRPSILGEYMMNKS